MTSSRTRTLNSRNLSSGTLKSKISRKLPDSTTKLQNCAAKGTFSGETFDGQNLFMHFDSSEVDSALDLFNICKKAGVEVEVVEV